MGRSGADKNSLLPIRIIACAVFWPAIEHLRLEERFPNVHVTYLSSDMHLYPQRLRDSLQIEVDFAKKRNERIICLYGTCFPNIDDFCEEQGVIKVKWHYCYEMLLGEDRFRQLIDEMAGTYFLEKDLIVNFRECCLVPLELDDEEVKRACFQHYQRLLYVRQPSDTDLEPMAEEIAEFLELPLEIRDSDYSQLEAKLVELISNDPSD